MYETAPCGTEHPLKLENLQAVIAGIDGNNTIVLINRHAPWVSKLPRLVAANAPDTQATAGFLVNQLHAVVSKLADDQTAARVQR